MAKDKKKPAPEEEDFTEEDLAAAAAAEEEVSEEELLAGAVEEEPPAAAATPVSPTERLRQAARNPGLLRTVGSSLLQGFTKGGSDEASGAIGALLTGQPMPGASWRETGESISTQGDVYRAARNSEREVLRGARENNPGTALAAQLAGDVGSDLVLAGLGARATRPLYNALTGSLSGLLGSDAELTPDKATPESMRRAAGDTAVGGVLGLVAPKVGEALGRVTPTALRALRNVADGLAVSQGRRVLLNGADQLARNQPTAPEAVLEAIDSGAIVPFGTTQGAFRRLERLAEERGATYGAILEELEKAGVRGPDAEALAKQLSERGNTLMSETGANKAVPNVFLDEASNLQSLGQAVPESRLGLGQAERIKRALQEQARYGELKDTPINDARQEVASRLRQSIEESVEGAGRAAPDGSDLATLAESFVPVKQQLGRTLEARGAAERGAAAAAKRRGLSLTDYMAAGMGSGLSEKISFATLNNFARNRGTSAVASGARGLSRLARAGANAAAANPGAVQRGGNEAGAALGRAFSPELAALLFGEEPQDATQAALEEALRRRRDAP